MYYKKYNFDENGLKISGKVTTPCPIAINEIKV